MSGQPEVDVNTSLEHLFASREFGQLRPVLPERADLVLARHFGGHGGSAMTSDPRGMLISSPVLSAAVAGRWRGHPARERVIAVVSGLVAAAALVVAGLAAGTTHHPPGEVSVLGSTTHSKGGGIRGIGGSGRNPSTIGPGATDSAPTAQVSGAGAGGSAAFMTASTALSSPTATAMPPRPVVVIPVPPGTTVAVVPAPRPSSAPPKSSTPSGGTPAPTQGAGNPLTPVASVVTSNTGTVSGATSSAVATAVPGATPTTASVGKLGSAVNAPLA